MDVLTIQWGWIGGYKTKVSPPIPSGRVVIEARKWPGPSIVLYREGETDTRWLRKLKREDEEMFLL